MSSLGKLMHDVLTSSSLERQLICSTLVSLPLFFLSKEESLHAYTYTCCHSTAAYAVPFQIFFVLLFVFGPHGLYRIVK